MGKNKKILTLDNLVEFYSKYKKSVNFNSKETGYQLAVQVPATFEIDDDYEDNELLFVLCKLFHTGVNRNHSNVTEEAAKKAMKGIAYKPLLANFCEIDGVKDFTSHDVAFTDDGIEYLERQIGCFTSDEPYMEYDEELGHNFVYAVAAIPREYTDAASIIERKGGTKISVELIINELKYNAKTKELLLTDVVVQGATCLGVNPETGEKVEEGMRGARLDIKDFSRENNSVVDFCNDEHSKLIDTLEKLNNTLNNISNFNINNDANASTKDYGKEEENVENEKLVNENVTEVEEAVEVENAETENTTVTETESTEEVTVENEEETVENNPEVVEVESANNVENAENVEEGSEEGSESSEESAETFEATEATEEVNKFSKTFELSHEDVRSALYQLLAPYEVDDNDWYWIVEVFDGYFVYQGCMGNYWGQKYVKDGDSVAFDGERYELFAEFVTTSEKAELEKMRSNYSSIESELHKYQEAELKAQREAVFNDEAYAEFVDKDSFKKIKENIDTYSVEDLKTACDLAFANEVKAKGTFAYNSNKNENKKTSTFFAFAKQERDDSFFDKLLGK